MMRIVNEYTSKLLISSFLLLIIGGIIFNYTFFLHSHTNSNDEVIVHAHPFKKSTDDKNSEPNHWHNKFDLQLISSIDYFIFPQVLTKVDYKPLIESDFLNESRIYVDSKMSLSIKKRGPPRY